MSNLEVIKSQQFVQLNRHSSWRIVLQGFPNHRVLIKQDSSAVYLGQRKYHDIHPLLKHISHTVK
jgi:hypothetical protein